MFFAQLDDSRRDLPILRRDLEQHVDVPVHFLEATVSREAQGRLVAFADAAPHRRAAKLLRLRAGRRKQGAADSAPARLRPNADHGERAPGDARLDHVRVAAVVNDAGARRRGDLVEGHRLVGIDIVVDLGAERKVGACLRSADHPDRFNFPCCFA